MRFTELSAQDKTYIKAIHADTDLSWDKRMEILSKKFSKSERTLRNWIRNLGYSDYKEVENDEIRQGKLRRYDLTKKYFIITWAQNATPVHKPFWDNLLTYAEFLDADVGVIMGKYNNPTSIYSETAKQEEYWDEAFTVRDDDGLITFSYLDGSRNSLHRDLDIIADTNIVPTASNPLSDMEGISGHRTSILGHPRVHLRSLPVLEGHHKKLILTTGACTIKNYTNSKVGKKGEFHHTLGAVIVEIKDEEIFYIRQITANSDGTFSDLVYNVDKEVYHIEESEAFIMGDLHVANVDEDIIKETQRYFKKVRPSRVVVHDVLDGQSCNHHETKDPIKSYQKFKEGRNIIKKEVDGVISFFDKYKLTDFNLTVVRSNHDMWLDRYIKDTDWRRDIPNSVEYMEYGLALLHGKAPKGLLPYLLEQHYGKDIKCLDLDESLKAADWELACHGHLGSNGAKGNIEGYRRLNTKVVVGDYHSANRRDGALSVGTFSKLRLGYNNGPSAWVHAGVVIHTDGKAQHLIFQKDKKCSTLI